MKSYIVLNNSSFFSYLNNQYILYIMYFQVLLCTRFLYVVPVLRYQTALSFFLRQLYHFHVFELGAGGAGRVRCTTIHTTDHAGPRRCECHPGTKFWHPPVEVTQFLAPMERFWRPFPFFERPNKNTFISLKQNSDLNHFQQLLFHMFPPPPSK